jgi:hypothetical protein
VFIFDNAVTFHTKRGEVIFGSFMKRDEFLEKINRLLNREELQPAAELNGNSDE